MLRLLPAAFLAAVAAWLVGAAAASFLSEALGWSRAFDALVGTLAGVLVLSLALGGISRQFDRLRDGGVAVARLLGARDVLPESNDPGERRLWDIARELATAVGTRLPRMAVLDGDASINACAVGRRPADAVLIFTRGALESLTREELTGVFAQAMANLLHGDTRPGLRLSIHAGGLQEVFETGRDLLADRVVGRDAAALHEVPPVRRNLLLLARRAVGGVLVVAGCFGWLAGRLLQRGAARSRSFRADATAIRVTRVPEALASALRKAQRPVPGGGEASGSTSRRAQRGPDRRALRAMTAQAWFVAPDRRPRGFGTHPAIADRIGRIAGRALLSKAPVHGGPVSDAWPLRWHVAAAAVRRPAEARAVALALLAPGQAASLKLSGAREPFAISPDTLPSPARQALFEMAAATLRHETRPARADLLREARRLVEADTGVTLLEFVFYLTLVERVGENDAIVPARPRETLRDGLRSLRAELIGPLRGARGDSVGRIEPAEASAALALLIRAALDWHRSRLPRSLRSLARAFDRAGAYWGWSLWSPPGALDARELIAAIRVVAALPTLGKARAVKALAAALLGDLNTPPDARAAQAAVLRALCFAWGVPLPPSRVRALKREPGESFAASPTLVYLDA